MPHYANTLHATPVNKHAHTLPFSVVHHHTEKNDIKSATGWKMCSLTCGNNRHKSGTAAAFQTEWRRRVNNSCFKKYIQQFLLSQSACLVRLKNAIYCTSRNRDVMISKFQGMIILLYLFKSMAQYSLWYKKRQIRDLEKHTAGVYQTVIELQTLQ